MGKVSGPLILLSSILLSNLAGCVPSSPPSPSSGFANWDSFQHDVATYLNKVMGTPHNMRIAPATVIYPIGTVVRRDTMSELSSKCSYRDLAVPAANPGPVIPEVEISRKFKIGANAGPLVQNGLSAISDAKLSYDNNASLVAGVTNTSTQQLAEDQVLQAISDEDCLYAVKGKDISVIRGYIKAEYNVTAGGGVDAGADVKVVSAQLLKVDYQNDRKFKLQESAPSEKFVILADGHYEDTLDLGGVFPMSAGGSKDDAMVACRASRGIVFDSPAVSRNDGKKHASDFHSCEEWETYMKSACKSDQVLVGCPEVQRFLEEAGEYH